MPVIDRAAQILVVLFVASRAVLYSLYPFRLDYLPWLNQLLDLEILRHNLIEGLFYLHATPPLYNAFVGVLLKAFPDQTILALAFQGLYGLMGLSVILMVYSLAKWFGATERVAFIAGLIVLCNPILFRFEIIPFYTFPLAFLLTLSVYALSQTLTSSSRTYGIAFIAIASTIVLFRNFFHVIVFLIPIAALGWYVLRTNVKVSFFTSTVVIAVCVGAALVPNIQNYLHYGQFTSSTWQGMQLYSMTYLVPEEKISALVTAGAITPLSLLPRSQNPDMYYAYYKEPVRNEIPALDALYKTGTEFGNFNNKIFIKTSEEYGQNARIIMSHYPWYFVPKFINSAYIFFGAANYRYFTSIDEWMIFDGPWYQRVYQATKYFVQPALLAMLFFAILGYLTWLLYSAVRTRAWSHRTIVCAYMLFIFVYVFGVANVVELGENFTARVPIDPLLTVCAVLLFSRLATRRGSAVV